MNCNIEICVVGTNWDAITEPPYTPYKTPNPIDVVGAQFLYEYQKMCKAKLIAGRHVNNGELPLCPCISPFLGNQVAWKLLGHRFIICDRTLKETVVRIVD